MKKSKLMNLLMSTLVLVAGARTYAESEGGSSPGGGNKVNDQIVASYIREISQIEGSENLARIINELKSKLPNLAGAISTRAKQMTWYMLPVKLKPLAEKHTGLPFKSEQATIQSLFSSEVFIDSNAFANFKESEKPRHLLHEIMESLVIVSDANEVGVTTELSYNRANNMKRVRTSVNIISNVFAKSEVELQKELKQISQLDSVGFGILKTASEIASESKQSQDAEVAKQKSIEENYPRYLQIVAQLSTAIDRYCASSGQLGVTYAQIANELSSNEKRQLLKDLAQLSSTATYLGLRAGAIELEYAAKSGFRTTDVLPYSQVIVNWTKPIHVFPSPSGLVRASEFASLFFQGRTLPTCGTGKAASSCLKGKLNYSAESIVNMHKVCSDLQGVKERLQLVK